MTDCKEFLQESKTLKLVAKKLQNKNEIKSQIIETASSITFALKKIDLLMEKSMQTPTNSPTKKTLTLSNTDFFFSEIMNKIQDLKTKIDKIMDINIDMNLNMNTDMNLDMDMDTERLINDPNDISGVYSGGKKRKTMKKRYTKRKN
jgi:hypothetical protein